MTNPVLLNNVDHQQLRVITTRGLDYGDNVMFTLTFPAEFRSAQAHYPIVFKKSADGSGFQPIVLFGFKDAENLFLGPSGWDASYLPLAMERQPFLIGNAAGESVIHVDLDSPRLSSDNGEALFLPHGGTTEFLERMNSVLLAIHEGLASTPAFVSALLAHELLESFVLDVELRDGSQNRFAGFYTINEERLVSLDGAALQHLHQAGYLLPIYMAIASLSNFRALIERQNRRHVGHS
jgi:hypothetical protein